MVLIKKEVIRDGTYWYRDEDTGQPRKLVVTPALRQHWHDQGNAMLSSGLTVPVPCEHDFDAHPMTPADRLKSNAGWVKQYQIEGDKLFAALDVTDEEIRKKLPHTIRWTSPWIKSFMDGAGKEWNNVISHLALTTRPRVVNQQPFASVAAALSMATETKPDALPNGAAGAGGYCLSRAGLLDLAGLPRYPVAFSLWGGGIPLATEHDKATGQFTSVDSGGGIESAFHRKYREGVEKSDHAHAMSHETNSGDAKEHAKKALGAAGKGDSKEAAMHHMNAAHAHRVAGGESHHKAAISHDDAVLHHMSHSYGFSIDGAAFSYPHGSNPSAQIQAIWTKDPNADDYENREGHEYGFSKKHKGGGGKLKKTGRRRKKKTSRGVSAALAASAPPPPKSKAKPGDDEAYDYEDEGDQAEEGAEYEHEYVPDGEEDANEDGIPDVLEDANSDIKMEELLCDLLQALGVPMPDESNPDEFKRHLYEAVMSKIKELTGKGMGKDDDKDKLTGKPDQNKPPGQNPHTSQPNPLVPQVQQEQQPMYMSLDEINQLPDPMKGVALAMYRENEKLRADVAASKKVTDGLRDAKLRECTGTRTSRVALISKLSPKVKGDLDAMLKMPAMALSMGEDGSVVDPMAQTLAMLEKGLADMPSLLMSEQSALSVQAQPTDATALTEERIDEIADVLSRQMGCAPQKQAS